MDKWSQKYIGNSARKREAAAEHNARYEQRDAVRPNLTKASRFKGKNVGTIGNVDHGIKPKESSENVKVIVAVAGFLSAIAAFFNPKKLIGR
ncbi:hypothetical protein RJP56_18915 [Shewanella baltica]|uniref:hypothetical protein n=1 Tax=Shewanella baltica TaxID=62322 RepID=UPI0028729035|nr:hypothetical protein [Shewanella baltica]MDR9768136.1 hypothetical protein [Shewanella baltica]